MTVREDCRHYTSRTVGDGEVVQRCKVGAADTMAFDCPQGCLFFEERPVIPGMAWKRPSGDNPL